MPVRCQLPFIRLTLWGDQRPIPRDLREARCVVYPETLEEAFEIIEEAAYDWDLPAPCIHDIHWQKTWLLRAWLTADWKRPGNRRTWGRLQVFVPGGPTVQRIRPLRGLRAHTIDSPIDWGDAAAAARRNP